MNIPSVIDFLAGEVRRLKAEHAEAEHHAEVLASLAIGAESDSTLTDEQVDRLAEEANSAGAVAGTLRDRHELISSAIAALEEKSVVRWAPAREVGAGALARQVAAKVASRESIPV